MAIDFPNSPTNGQTFVANGITYKYDSSVGAWLIDSYTSNDYVAPAFLQANTARDHANAAFNAANNAVTDFSPAFLQANLAFAKANAALPNTSGSSFNGSLNFPTGNVLIGRTDSTVGLGVKLDVNGAVNAAALYVNGATLQSGATIYDDTINATRYVTFVDATSGTMLKANVDTALSFNPSTGILSSTLFNSTSDINKKENIVQVTDALNILDQIDGVRFTWKNNGLPSLGVIAQQVEKVLPEIVESEKSVNYNGLIAVLIEAVKELKSEIEELKKSKW